MNTMSTNYADDDKSNSEKNKPANHSADDAPPEFVQFNETLSWEGSFEDSLKKFADDFFKDDASSRNDAAKTDTTTPFLSRRSSTTSDFFGAMGTKAIGADLSTRDEAADNAGGESFEAAVSTIGDNDFGDGDGDGDGDGNQHLAHKSNSTEIYRVTKTAITVDLGIKVIADESMPLMQQYESLRREQKISAFLPSSVRRRHVLDLKKFVDGRPGLWFKWERGTTLEAWLQAADRGDHELTQTARVKIAMAVTRTLSQFHANGVYCRKLSPKDIVLDREEGMCVATFIDLSEAGFLETADSNIDLNEGARKRQNDDLRLMGHTFIRIFQEGSIDNGEGIGDKQNKILDVAEAEDDQCNNSHGHRKRGKVSVPGEDLCNSSTGEDLPLYLRALISSLILSGNESTTPTYKSAQDVFIDLKKFAENTNGISQRQQQNQHVVGELAPFRVGRRLPSFYGRQVQLSMLHHFFDSVVGIHDCSPMMAMISGCAGSG